MPYFSRQGVRLHFRETGAGMPFVFQHGLGSDITQPFGLFHPPSNIRLIAFDCRGHGGSELGPAERVHLSEFAEDLMALLEHLGIATAVVGGISMGAAIALNFALRHPAQVRGLVLSRPAWLDAPNPWNVRVFGWLSELIRRHGPVQGAAILKASKEFAEIESAFPATARSLADQFINPRAGDVAVALDQIPRDAPSHDRAQWRAMTVPTLVLANRQDPIHPFEYGEILASHIPAAQFRELTPKAVDPGRHAAEVQSCIETFLDAIRHGRADPREMKGPVDASQ